MKKRMSWYWALPAVAGLALMMVAAMLSSSGSAVYATTDETSTAVANQTATAVALTPTATATPNPNCILSVSKDYDSSTAPEGGEISYTISIDNNGTGDNCTDLTVKDVIPDDTDCVSATVDSSSDIDDSDFDITGCDSEGTIKWYTDTNFDTGDTVVLDLTLELTSGANDGDHITNEACATSTNDKSGDCDSAKIKVSGTATPTTGPTATTYPTVAAIPTVYVPPAALPTARVLPTLSVPSTGTGPDSNSHALVIGLGLIGVCLLLVSGAVVVKRTR